MKKFISIAFITTLLFNLSACGTILHPERKGQRSGNIDAGVAVLDGIGLLFFVIPGVIAYAVDFTNGTIYLPGGKRSSLETDGNTDDILALHVGKENLSENAIQHIIQAQTGKAVNTTNAQIYKMHPDGTTNVVDKGPVI